MRLPARLVYGLIALLALIILPASPSMAATGCNNCATIVIPNTNVAVSTAETANASTVLASLGYGKFTVTITKGVSTVSMPPNFPEGAYQAWCGTAPTDLSAQSNEFTVTTNLGATNPRIDLVLNKLNYIVNNKQGTVTDVQEALWVALGTRPYSYLVANHLDTAKAMVDAANAAILLDPTWTPAPGQKSLVVLLSNTVGVQNLLVEVVHCGQIGDRVWRDSNSNGIQDFGEPGINGVVVKLFDGATEVGSTVTSPIPFNYPYTLKVLTPAEVYGPVDNGWYQFTGIDCTKTFTVRIDTTQATLTGTTPTVANQGTNRAVDSNGIVNGAFVDANVALNMTVNPSIDESIDFGFVGTPAMDVTCPRNWGLVALSYSSFVVATGGSPNYTFSITSGSLPPGLTLSASTGKISGTPTTTGTYAIEITVRDSQGRTKAVSCSIKIDPQPIVAKCPGVVTVNNVTTVKTGKVGEPYSEQFVISGGNGVYEIEITDGMLPPGLTMDANGVISGTPTMPGTYSFTYMVRDSTHSPVYRLVSNCSITILPAALTLMTCPTTVGSVGSQYTSAVLASGGRTPYTFTVSAGSLPTGLTLNATTGQITGTPQVKGSYSFTIRVTDADGAISEKSCSISISGKFTVTCPLALGVVGSGYNGVVTVSGGPGQFTFSLLTAGTLPPGLDLNSLTGAITGTPTMAGTFTFTIRVVDSSIVPSVIEDVNCTITISVTANCPEIRTAIVGQAYTGTLTGIGGTGPYVFSNVIGLPAEFSLSSAGVLTGNPTMARTVSFSATVTDSTGKTGTVSCTIVVLPRLTVTCPGVVTIQAGQAYSSTLAAAGGQAPYRFAVTGGTVPPGLTLDPDSGLLSGVPLRAGTYSFTVTVTDFNGFTATTGVTSCTITVTEPPITATCPAASGTVGVQYNSLMTPSGGLGATYTFSNWIGLPAGLTGNPDGTITGLPTAAGSFNFQVDVTDANGNKKTVTGCTITIVPPPLVAVCAPAVTGQVGTGYSSQVQVTGGTPSYTFALASGTLPPGLNLDANTGIIIGTPTTAGTYSFAVKVTDSTSGTAMTATTTNCTITIAPPPLVAVCAPAVTGQVGTGYSSQVQVTGGTASYTFSLASGSLPPGLTLNATTGVISGSPTTAGTYSFSVKVTDSTSGTAMTATTTNCSITIAPPPLVAVCAPGVTGQVGVAYSSQVQVTGGTAPYTFVVATGALPAGLTLNATTGVISGIPLTAGAASFTIGVTDSTSGAALTASTGGCGIAIAPPTISANCVSIAATQGTPITPVKMIATGGIPGYTFSATGLPAGLTMAADGTISGTPTVNGTFNYTVTIVDSRGNVGTVNCSVTVLSTNVCGLTWGYWKNHLEKWPVQTLTMGGKPYSNSELLNLLGLPVAGDASLNLAHQLIAAKLNVFNGTNIVTDGGAIAAADNLLATYNGKLPLGVSSTSTAGTQMVSIAAQLDYFNQDGQAQPGCFNGPAPLAVTCAASTGQVGTPYSSAIVVSGGFAPYTFAIVSGSLPAGLTLNPTTGAITGTPTAAGTFAFSIQVADSTNILPDSTVGTITKNCSITIAPPPTVTASCIAITALQGVAITPVTMAASGGTGGPYTFTATGLPTGLSISSGGTISGTPTVSGSFSYTVTIKDKDGNIGTVNCSVTVAPTPVPSTTCLAITAVQGVAITPVTMLGSGGTGAPYTFSATGLPAGLTMSSDGRISGTPTVSGTFAYTVTVKDKDNNTGTVNCSVTVAPPPVIAICGLTWGYWKNHVTLWPASSLPMILGAGSYSSADLQTVLKKSVAGDVSIELMHQLIAAKFNVANGTPIATANGAIAAADSLLSPLGGKNTGGYKISASSTLGQQMVTVAKQLDYFNQDGKAQPGCVMTSTSTAQGSIGNFVWVDANFNGVQDIGESGLDKVTVRLRDANNNLLATDVTDGSGQYEFTGLSAGAYVVEVVAPSGWTPTLVGAATTNGDKDSNANPTVVVLPTNNSSRLDTDFGFFKTGCTGSIGNLVWVDSNGNGIQDAGEPGIPGVLVSLSASGVTGTAMTDGNGNYLFPGLCAAAYSVSVTTPPGYTPTMSLSGADRTKDSNASPSSVTLGSNSTADLTVDFGFMAITNTSTGFTTFTQGGWGSTPNGNNPGSLLKANFTRVYPAGVSIGGSLKLTFSSQPAVQGFLPQGGTAGALLMSDVNPTGSAAGVFAGQVLALQLSVDFSKAGVTKAGLDTLKVANGKLNGTTVAQVLALANSVLGGGSLPGGLTISDLNSVIDAINNNYDNGTVNNGYLK